MRLFLKKNPLGKSLPDSATSSDCCAANVVELTAAIVSVISAMRLPYNILEQKLLS